MADATVIGRSTFVRGKLSGTGDLDIEGRVEGGVEVTGDVRVAAGGLVGSSIHARRITVRGAVKGDLVADDAVVLEAGARVVGDLRAPRIAIAPGGLVRGHVQTGQARAGDRPRAAVATQARPAARPAAPAARPAAPAAKPAPKAEPAHVTKPAAKTAAATKTSGRAGPPPPVVPVLKKGTKAVQKKR